jgi:predicted nucleic acid-binding protein
VCRAAVQRDRPALAGHAVFETFSVLTRMPGALGVDAPTAAEVLNRVFGEVVWLGPEASAALRSRLAALGIIGGAVYDALVGEAARVNDRQLLTRDRRAVSTYRLLGVSYRLIEP